ncbi:MAG: hypothetical protein ACOCRX_04845 [Candidatus Woesearchaeota archaeon]
MGKFMLEEVKKVKKAIKDKADFVFIPHDKLVKDILHNSNLYAKELPSNVKKILLAKKGLRISPRIVLKYYKGVLDKKNSYILDNGDVQIIRQKIDLTNIN